MIYKDREVIYFDNAATTRPSRNSAVAFINETRLFANPSSLHRLGFEAEQRLAEYRESVAQGLHCMPDEIVFTSGGTEANNLAVLGAAYKNRRRGKRIITSDSEHASVAEAMKKLEEDGFEIIRLSTVGGKLDPAEIEQAATENVILVSVMHTNNETGAVYDIRALSDIIHKKCPHALIHSDCVQAYMKTPFSPKLLGADLISVSAHKICAPKGSGALYIKRGTKLLPRILGGGQEKGLRSGTESMMTIAGFAAATKENLAVLNENIEKMRLVRNTVLEGLSDCSKVTFNIPAVSAPHILNLSVSGEKSEVLLHKLSDRDIFVSSGSACSSNSKRSISQVLVNFGLTSYKASSAIRLSFNHENTVAEAERFCAAIKEIIKTGK